MAQTQYKSIDLRGYLDLNKNELRNPQIHNLGSDPASPVAGQAYWNTTSKRVRLYHDTLAAFTDVLQGSLFTAKGDILSASAANTPVVLGVGTNGTFLVAASGQASGMQWRVPVTGDINLSGTSKILGRVTAAAGPAEELTLGTGLEFSGSTIQNSAFTGDITKAAGSNATTIGAGTVTLAKMANLAANSIIGNNTGGATTPIALTVAQTITLLNTGSAFDTQVRTSRLDQMAAPTASVSMNSQKITGLAAGTNPTDGVNFSQISAITTGQSWRNPVAAVSTTNITLSGTQTIDGYSAVAGDRILVAGQTTTANDGIYVVAAGAWARDTDADTAAEVSKGTTVLVLNGTANKGDVFTQTLVVTTLGTDAQTWVKTSDTNTLYTADEASLTLGGGTSFSIKAGGIDLSGTQIASAALPATKGGTGQAGGYAVGDILYASAAGTLSKLADVATGNALISGGVTTAPSWGKIGLTTHVSGTLPESSGGTGQAGGYAVGDILYASGAATLSKLADVATGNVLISGGVTTAPAWGKVGLTTHVTGILPEANGGTNASTFAAALATANAVRKFAQAITGGATSEVITHNLNTRDLTSVTLINNATPWDAVEVEWEATSVNTVTLRSPVNLPASYRVIVSG